MLDMGGDIALTLREQGAEIGRVKWYPAAADEVWIQDANEENVAGGVLQKSFSKRPGCPHRRSKVLVNAHDFG